MKLSSTRTWIWRDVFNAPVLRWLLYFANICNHVFRVKGGVGKGSSPKAGGAAKGGAGSTGSTGGTGGDENYSYDDEEEDYDDAAEEGSGKTILFLLILFVSPLFWECAKYFCRQLKKDQVNR